MRSGLVVEEPTAPASVLDLTYAFDANHRKSLEMQSAPEAPERQVFGYDAEGRLRAWSRTPGALGMDPPEMDQQIWDISPVGDWTSTVINGTVQQRTHSPVHEIATIDGQALTYDPAGNLVKDERGQGFDYDEDNRVVQGIITAPGETSPGVYAARYDALGRRLAVRQYSRETVFVLDGAQVVREYDRRITATESEVASDGAAPRSGAAPAGSLLGQPGTLAVNFQPAGEPIPDGWLADKGRLLGARTNGHTYGWSAALEAPALVASQVMASAVLDTQARPITKTWSLTLANGTYAVVVVAGDPRSVVHSNHLVLDGELLRDPDPAPDSPSGYVAGDFDGWATEVTVTDGTLTLTAASDAIDPSLCFIEIGPLGSRVDAELRSRLETAIATASSRTGYPPFPMPRPSPRTFVYDGGYIDATVAFRAGDAMYGVHANHLYTPMAVTDSTGAVVERYSYDAYGTRTVTTPGGTVLPKSTIGFQRGFTGYSLDEETGLYYARARMYSPSLGRFVSRDPGQDVGPGMQRLDPELASWRPMIPIPYGKRGYQDGMSLYRAYFVPGTQDPFGLALPTFKGFENERYQQHDGLIEELVGSFNKEREKWCGCTDGQAQKVTDLDPVLIKSWVIQESGGGDQQSKDAWGGDPAQVNVPRDWNQWKVDVGLTKPTSRNEGNVRGNLTAALKYLCRKGFGKAGQPASNRPEGFFDGWPKAFERYNGRTDVTVNGNTYSQNYSAQIFGRAQNPTVYYSIELPAKR